MRLSCFRLARLALVLCACLLVPAAAHARARSISTNPSVPDSDFVRPVIMKSLPIWVGADLGRIAKRNEWTHLVNRGTKNLGSFSLMVPVEERQTRLWVSCLYEQVIMDSHETFTIVDSSDYSRTYPQERVAASLFLTRVGGDWLFGDEARPVAFVGGGIGVGGGNYTRVVQAATGNWRACEGVARAGAYAYPWKHSRIGLAALGSLSYRMAGDYRKGSQSQLQLVLSFETQLEVPRRLLDEN